MANSRFKVLRRVAKSQTKADARLQERTVELEAMEAKARDIVTGAVLEFTPSGWESVRQSKYDQLGTSPGTPLGSVYAANSAITITVFKKDVGESHVFIKGIFNGGDCGPVVGWMAVSNTNMRFWNHLRIVSKPV